MITASDWRPLPRGSMLGFVTLKLQPSGLVLHDCTLHGKPDGSRWVGLPGKPQLDEEKRLRKDPTTGKGLYTPVVEIPNKTCRERFKGAALAAIDELLGGGAP
jgi:hypothetical protein